ncbi:MAG: DUF3416 domain-containing protein, partial [Flavobacterium sp.]|nr:DUF3416 domain-containing protein [Flavobacterium sp.]
MLNQKRVLIENVLPQLDNGQFFIKRIVNQSVKVTADVFADGHDVLQAVIKFKHESDTIWTELRMNQNPNDAFDGVFIVQIQGYYSYFIEAWVDYALNWQYGIEKKAADNQHVKSELLEGIEYLKPLVKTATAIEKKYLTSIIKLFSDEASYNTAVVEATSTELKLLFNKYPAKVLANQSNQLKIYVDRQKALFSTWYEFFPRSASPNIDQHGTFSDCEQLLPRVAAMGFDTLYFPPIHPIGEINRKGVNNATNANEGDVGSPWGIGSKLGGHKHTHPE